MCVRVVPPVVLDMTVIVSDVKKRKAKCGFGKGDGSDGGRRCESSVDCAATGAHRQHGAIRGEE